MEKERYWKNPALEKQQAQERRAEAPEINRAYKLKKNYNLSLEQYQEMFDRQNGCCAGCRLPPIEGKLLAVDHCHRTGKVRGLLHNNCNIIIGMAKESSSILMEITKYMENFND